MWQADIEPLDAGRVQRIRIRSHASLLDYAGVLECLALDANFRAFFSRLLADAPYGAYFWETPPVTRQTAGQPFECVLVDAPVLDGVTADDGAFARYFPKSADDVVDFPNLGRDAWLVVPCPRGPQQVHAHLAAFVRGAPATQQQAFWQRLGGVAGDRLSAEPLWLSTSGLGVYWLHVRLDSLPKYYTWRPYAR